MGDGHELPWEELCPIEDSREDTTSSEATMEHRDANGVPPHHDAHPADIDYFWAREHEATAFLMTTLSDEMVVAVSNKRYAHDIFQHLEKTYEPRNWRKSAHSS
ncbi:hypothetical protein PI124_g22783 [Phytophthora idaei]|nr:hypothetical protein PI125_g24697 [Phytophthora idaei]KAG3125508.1 hypothetical protein PI126_g22731 [Phytophthora idaei]KAG3232128.1 hypothetical protein PI124_g22783 [Phytophthora idaei]